jgi:hypothetical protein
MYQPPIDPQNALAAAHEEERQFAESAEAERLPGMAGDRRLAIVLFILILALPVVWIVRTFVLPH